MQFVLDIGIKTIIIQSILFRLLTIIFFLINHPGVNFVYTYSS